MLACHSEFESRIQANTLFAGSKRKPCIYRQIVTIRASLIVQIRLLLKLIVVLPDYSMVLQPDSAEFGSDRIEFYYGHIRLVIRIENLQTKFDKLYT